MKCGIAPLGPMRRERGRERAVEASKCDELSPHLGECQVHKSSLEIQEKVGISEATVPRGLSCIGVDVEVSLR